MDTNTYIELETQDELRNSSAALLDCFASVPQELMSRINVKDLVATRDRMLTRAEEQYAYLCQAKIDTDNAKAWFNVVVKMLNLESYKTSHSVVTINDDSIVVTANKPGTDYKTYVATITAPLSYSSSVRGSAWRSRRTTGSFVEMRLGDLYSGRPRRYTIKDPRTFNWCKLDDLVTEKLEQLERERVRIRTVTKMKREKLQQAQEDFSALAIIEETGGHYTAGARHCDRTWIETKTIKSKPFGPHNAVIALHNGADEENTYLLTLNVNRLNVETITKLIKVLS